MNNTIAKNVKILNEKKKYTKSLFIESFGESDGCMRFVYNVRYCELVNENNDTKWDS